MIRLQHPVPGASVGDRFGWRPPIPAAGIHEWNFHNGADYPAVSGTPILAAHAGRVTLVGWDGPGGWSVQISAAFGRTYYAHMLERSTLVRSGDEVRAGQPIGHVGMSGTASGTHLHFMLDTGQGWIDPVPYITSTPTPPTPKADDDMAKNSGFYYTTTPTETVAASTVYLIVNAASGFYSEYSNGPGAGALDGKYNNPVAAAFETGNYAPITESHAAAIKASCDRVLAR